MDVRLKVMFGSTSLLRCLGGQVFRINVSGSVASSLREFFLLSIYPEAMRNVIDLFDIRHVLYLHGQKAPLKSAVLKQPSPN